MTDLAQLQRSLLSLLKARPLASPVDPYLQRVAESNELSLAREIALWWRAFSLESYCVFTSTLLKRLGTFDQEIEAFFNEGATSPFIEQLSQDFLAWASTYKDPLVASMARFERTLLRVKRGDTGVYVFEWNRNPESLFSAILQGRQLPPAEMDHIYRITVSARIPKLVRCELVEKRSKASESLSKVGTVPSSTVSCMDSRHARD
jgi:hypothetical protein